MKRDPADVVVDIILILAQAGLVLFVLASLFVFQGCAGSSDDPFPKDKSPNVTQFDFKPNRQSFTYGIPVDDKQFLLEMDALDTMFAQTIQCLSAIGEVSLTDLARLPTEFGVLVPTTFYVSPCTGEEVFECFVAPESCSAKGYEPSSVCPCRCRSVIQDHRIIVTTPNMKVLPGKLVTLITGVENPWADAKLAHCANIENPSLK